MFQTLSTLRQLMRTSAVVRKLNDLDMFDEIHIVRTPEGFSSTIRLRYYGITANKSLQMANFIADHVKKTRKREDAKQHRYPERIGARPKTRTMGIISKIYVQRNDSCAVRKFIENN